jgi:hypothetical protein
VLQKLQIVRDFIWGILAIGASVLFFIDGEIVQGIISLVAGIALAYYFGFRKWKKGKKKESFEEKVTNKKIKVKGVKLKVLLARLKSSKKVVFGIVVLLLAGVLVFIVPLLVKKTKDKPAVTHDDYPIFLLRDGDVSVYREMNVYEDHIEKRIIVANLGNEKQEDLKIYEAIPKEIAYTAGNLTFSEEPVVIEDDPVVRWDIDTLYASGEPVEFTWKVGGTVGKARSVLGKTSSQPILDTFETHWPSLTLADPVKTWREFYEFSKSEMEKSSKAATAGKAITVSKDIVDVMAILATGTGALDALNLMSELHSIGTTIYDEESPEAIADANQWLMIIGLVQNGYENRELLKTSMQQGVNVLKASKGAQAAKTTKQLAKTADAMDDVADGVSAAESAGLNIAGMIVDYAVINDVAKTAKYNIFEMNEQSKMVYLSGKIVELWEKYEDGQLTEGEAKTLMELETLFFIVQQNELKVRKEYFASQTGVLDTAFSWLPVVGDNSAKQGLVDTEELLKAGQNQISWRRNSIRKVYAGAKAISDQEELKKLEEEALKQTENQHAEDEEVADIVPAGTSEYKKLRSKSKGGLFSGLLGGGKKDDDQKEKKTTYRLTTDETLTSKPQPTSKPSSGTNEFDFSLDNFPDSLLGNSKAKTGTTPAADQCYKDSGYQQYIYAEYGSGNDIITVGVGDFGSSYSASSFTGDYVDCMNDLFGGTVVSVVSEGSVAGYPFNKVTADLGSGSVIAGTSGVVGKYVITLTVVTPTGTGGAISGHKEVMANIIQAFTGGEVIVISTPVPSSPSGCVSIDLGTNYKSYYYYKNDQPCTSYTRNASSTKFNVKCNQPVARWRESYIRPYSLSKSGPIRVKATVKLIDHSRFFVESGGIGVKYDDYVNLLVYSSDPRPMLENECNRGSSQTDWAKCALRNTQSGVLGTCGVPKYTESKTCNFTVNAPSSQIYFGFGVSDAWPNEVDGILSNLQVCYE